MHGDEKIVYVEAGTDFTLQCSVGLKVFGILDNMPPEDFRQYLKAKQAIEQGIGSAIYRDSV